MHQIERRRYKRARFLSNVLVRVLPTGFPLDAYALDLGEDGLTLVSKHLIPVGQSVEVLLATTAPAEKRTYCRLDARVAYGRKESEGHVMGFIFVRPLSAEEFQILRRILVGIGGEL